jgi:4'-phosphopantetheinyl transferase EntD
MADAFSQLLSALRPLAIGLKGDSRPEWGAHSSGSRNRLRQALAHALAPLSADDQRALADLNDPPRPSNWSISISHTHDYGGWMAVPRPAQVGWDVELSARIKRETIGRVCSAQELLDAPEAAFLWCAKEAFFKALEDEQPLSISQLTIGQWRADGVSLWRWHGLGPRNGEGILIRDGDWLMAASVIA